MKCGPNTLFRITGSAGGGARGRTLSFDGPTGKVTLDKATHHSVRNAFLAEAKDKLWDVVASYPDQKPSDTAAVCDLVKNPNDNKQYVISL